ncbi:disulfide bond formation protein B [Xanthobacter sp. KR7-65]|uniref:disulfide bond formation protein B n=1 Tax=Xanthobacter sp. KR7-65 TaxID=3156612 RepID=UPI0032B40645
MVMRLSRTFDVVALAGVCGTLVLAFYYQLVLGELPCALCNLQRLAFIIFGGGLLLNIRYGSNPWNYVMSAVAALVGSLISLLQMFVHAPPGTPPTGAAFLWLHMYDWGYIALTAAVFYSLFSLAYLANAFMHGKGEEAAGPPKGAAMVTMLFVILISAALVSAFLENGFEPFKSGGQIHYKMLYDGDVMKP